MEEDKEAGTALSLARALVMQSFPMKLPPQVGQREGVDGAFWAGVDRTDREAVMARLREMADLIADLKNRMLK